MHRATALRRSGDRLELALTEDRRVSARAVILATGASYRRLGVPSLEALSGAGVFYGGPASEAHALSGKDVYVAGGGNSAGQAALHLARYARRVTLARARAVARSRDVALPGAGGGGDPEHRGAARHDGGRRRRGRPPAAAGAARERRRRRQHGRRRRPVRVDRGPPAHGLAARRDRARRGMGSCSRATSLRTATTGRSTADRSRSRRACPACSRPETCGAPRSSEWHRRWGRARSRSSSPNRFWKTSGARAGRPRLRRWAPAPASGRTYDFRPNASAPRFVTRSGRSTECAVASARLEATPCPQAPVSR